LRIYIVAQFPFEIFSKPFSPSLLTPFRKS